MRIQSVDIARGLCIILVVWGHNAQFTDTVINHALWTIRMPMMFFVAGSFIKYQQPFRQLVWEKADALLKPFVVMALLQAPARMFIGETDPASLAIGIMAGGGYYLPWVYYLWYLPHLWLVFMGGHILLHAGRFGKWPPVLKILSIALALCVGIWTSNLFPGAPYKLGGLTKNLAFFMLGFLCRSTWTSNPTSWPLSAVALSTLLASQYLLQSGAVDVSSAEYVIAFMLSALAGITLLTTLAKRLARMPLASTALSRCGRESLFILLFHWPLQNLGRHAWPWVLPDNMPWLTAFLSWVGSICLSLVLARVMRSYYWTAVLWLPVQSARKMRGIRLPAPIPRTTTPAQREVQVVDFADTLPEINARAMR